MPLIIQGFIDTGQNKRLLHDDLNTLLCPIFFHAERTPAATITLQPKADDA
jgi:hypothetical protein